MVMMGRRIISRYLARFAGCTLGAVAVAILVALSAYAVGKDQRKIFDWGVPYHNIEPCVPGGGNLSIGDNKDYEGNQILKDDELERVKHYQPIYQKVASKYGVAWQILAAIHYRESGVAQGSPHQCEGPYGYDPDGKGHGRPDFCAKELSDAKFEEATEVAMQELESKHQAVGGGDWNDPRTIKRSLFAYNSGQAYVLGKKEHRYVKQAENLGFSHQEGLDGEGSPYVMNKADEKRDPNKNGGNWCQSLGPGSVKCPANQDYGAYVVYLGLGGGSGSSSGGASIEKRIEERAFWVGDKRAIGLQNAGGKNDKDIWVTDENDGYDWFVNTAINQVSGQLKESEGQAQNSQDQNKDKKDKDKDKDKDKKGDTIVFALGVNDMAGGAKRYTDKLKELVADNGAWAKARKVLVVSVNPVLESKTQIKNADIEKFNNELKSGLSGSKKLEYIDVYTKFKKDIKETDFEDDGINYKSELNKKIYEFIRDGDPDRNKDECGEASTGLNGSIADVAKAMAAWENEDGGTCYAWGGGHVENKEHVEKLINAHFRGMENGVDCSGFVASVVYKATGYLKTFTTEAMPGIKAYQKVTDPQPGDIAWWKGHVEIYLGTNSDGTYHFAGSRNPGCGKNHGPSIVDRKDRHGVKPEFYRYVGTGAT